MDDYQIARPCIRARLGDSGVRSQYKQRRQGGFSSSRPAWLPSNNVTPIELPVFRLEDQEFARYFADGKAVDAGANSVLMAADSTDTATAVQDLVGTAVADADDNLIRRPSLEAQAGWSNIDLSLKGDVLHFTGNAKSERLRKLAVDAAIKSLADLHLTSGPANDVVTSEGPAGQ